MRTLVLVYLLVMALPDQCIASEGLSAWLFSPGMQLFYFSWPLVLPFFFVPSGENQTRNYLLLLVLVYGVQGLVGLPVSGLYHLSYWLKMDLHTWFFSFVAQIVSVGAGVVVLKRYSAAAIHAFRREG